MTKELIKPIGYYIQTLNDKEEIKITIEQKDRIWQGLQNNNSISHFKIGDKILHRSEIRKILPYYKNEPRSEGKDLSWML